MSHYIKRQKLKFKDMQEIELPMDCVFLSVSVYQGEPCLYVLINRDTCLSTTMYHVSMPLTEQLFCYDKDFVFQGSLNIKNVTAHFFIKKLAYWPASEPINTEGGIQPDKKKRGRPKKYKEAEK